MTQSMVDKRALIATFYDAFNQRRFADAAALFADDAVLEHATPRRQEQGGAGYLIFARIWTQAFPDAALTIERIASQDEVTFEVELLVTGTHLGALDMGSCGVFKPSNVRAALRVRQLLEIPVDRIVFSSLSFDVHDLVHQLVSVDTTKLLEHIVRLQQLAEKLAATPEDDAAERRNVVDRLGTELDAARRVARPYFNR
jgi:hypothetical protein